MNIDDKKNASGHEFPDDQLDSIAGGINIVTNHRYSAVGSFVTLCRCGGSALFQRESDGKRIYFCQKCQTEYWI